MSFTGRISFAGSATSAKLSIVHITYRGKAGITEMNNTNLVPGFPDLFQFRFTASNLLQDDLARLGYNYPVTASRDASELQITSEDFRNTEQRVRFLALLR